MTLTINRFDAELTGRTQITFSTAVDVAFILVFDPIFTGGLSTLLGSTDPTLTIIGFSAEAVINASLAGPTSTVGVGLIRVLELIKTRGCDTAVHLTGSTLTIDVVDTAAREVTRGAE